MKTRLLVPVFALGMLAARVSAEAQAWSYPSFQAPRLAAREFNFGVANASGAGTSLLFQWREEAGPRHQLSLDVGIADPEGANADLEVFVGGQYAYQLAKAGGDVPLDFLFTAGAYLAGGEVTIFRFPVGLSLGHRFPLDGGVAITPYVHPRVSLDLCSECQDETDIALSFDIGANFELTRTVALRFSALFAGDNTVDDDGFGVSFAWTPPALSRIVRRGR